MWMISGLVLKYLNGEFCHTARLRNRTPRLKLVFLTVPQLDLVIVPDADLLGDPVVIHILRSTTLHCGLSI